MEIGTQCGGPSPAPQPNRGQRAAASIVSQGRLCPSAKRREEKRFADCIPLPGSSAERYSAQTKDGGPGRPPRRSPQRWPSPKLRVLKFRPWSKTALQGGEEKGGKDAFCATGQRFLCLIYDIQMLFLHHKNVALLFPEENPF